MTSIARRSLVWLLADLLHLSGSHRREITVYNVTRGAVVASGAPRSPRSAVSVVPAALNKALETFNLMKSRRLKNTLNLCDVLKARVMSR